MVEITPEIQAQLNEQKKTCIFCKIVSGETESKEIYKDSVMQGILDIHPAVKGHALFLPKEHYPIMPYLPAKTFTHLFGTMAALVGAAKKSLLVTGANVFVANGGVAGQQAPHFLVHLLPREKGDEFDTYGFTEDKGVDKQKLQEAISLLAQNLPIMMQNHFKRNPAAWNNGNIKTAEFLTEKKKQTVIYEDEKALVIIPENPQCVGHVQIFSQEQEHDFEKLDKETAAHLFFVASFAATAVFEGLGAHGTNIILKTGVSHDNPDGLLSLHVLPRYENDGLDVLWKPMESVPNLDDIVKKMKNGNFMIEHAQKGEKKKEVIDLDVKKEVISEKPTEKKEFKTPEEEILDAIDKVKQK